MRILTVNVFGVIGISLGAAIAILAVVLNKRAEKKKRLLDERYQTINNRAKGIAWNVTAVLIWTGWALTMFIDGITWVFFLFMVMHMIHVGVYGFTRFQLEEKY